MVISPLLQQWCEQGLAHTRDSVNGVLDKISTAYHTLTCDLENYQNYFIYKVYGSVRSKKQKI